MNTKFSQIAFILIFLIVLPTPVSADAYVVEYSQNNQTWQANYVQIGHQAIHLRLVDSALQPVAASFVDGNNVTQNNPFIPKIGLSQKLTAKSEAGVELASSTFSIYPKLEITELLLGESAWIEVFNPESVGIKSDLEFKFGAKTVKVVGAQVNPGYNVYSMGKIDVCTKTCLQEVSIAASDLSLAAIELDLAQKSQARFSGTWYLGWEPSAGAANMPPQGIIISEIYPSPESGETEWLEIFNSGSKDIPLTGFSVVDTKNVDALGGIIPAQAHLKISPTKVTLNNDGDTIQIKFGELANDNITYPQITKGNVWKRLCRGTKYLATWEKSDSPTPGIMNSCAVSSTTSSKATVSSKTTSSRLEAAATAAASKTSTQIYQLPKLSVNNNVLPRQVSGGFRIAAVLATAAILCTFTPEFWWLVKRYLGPISP